MPAPMMPIRMNDADCTLAGRQAAAAVPVLFISGYAEPLVEGTGASALTDPVLAKPFTPRQFLHAVRDVLSRSPRRLPA
jgi:DNA-binding response OmpR family regulator